MRRLLARAHGRVRAHPDAALATALALATASLLALTASAGIVRDEGYYFRAAREYHAWFEALWGNLLRGDPGASFSDAALRRAFGYNTEHPGLVKLLMGFTWKVLHGWLGGPSTLGFRLAAILVNAVGFAFTYLLGARAYGRAAGLAAVALLVAAPHVFYHAHLAAFDGPVTALTVTTVYAFWRSLESRRWVVAAGVSFGLALATKHNAVFLLPALALAHALSRRKDFRVDGGLALPPLPLAFVAMLVIGPLVLYLLYPYGWHAPLERLGAYYGYHLRHEHYPVDYFGTLYRRPPFPWAFPFVMSGITVPLTTLVAGVAGLLLVARRALREGGAGDWLVLVSALVPLLVIALPSVPIFGGTKHWMPMMPFFCIAAGLALSRALAQLRAAGRPVLGGLLVAAMLALPAIETVRTHPFGHTYFNELVLGHQGGAALGMARGFWGGAGGALLPAVDARARPGDALFTHRMNRDSFAAYQADGALRPDVRWTGDILEARFALLYHQREHQDAEYAAWLVRGDRRPLASIVFDGVPIVSLYSLEPAAGETAERFRPPRPGLPAPASEDAPPPRPGLPTPAAGLP